MNKLYFSWICILNLYIFSINKTQYSQKITKFSHPLKVCIFWMVNMATRCTKYFNIWLNFVTLHRKFHDLGGQLGPQPYKIILILFLILKFHLITILDLFLMLNSKIIFISQVIENLIWFLQSKSCTFFLHDVLSSELSCLLFFVLLCSVFCMDDTLVLFSGFFYNKIKVKSLFT